MEQLIILLDGSCKMEVRKMLISGKDAVSRVQEQDSLLYELGITTANSIQDFRIFEKSGREMRARGDSEKTKAAASHLITLFINDCGVKKVAKGKKIRKLPKEICFFLKRCPGKSVHPRTRRTAAWPSSASSSTPTGPTIRAGTRPLLPTRGQRGSW